MPYQVTWNLENRIINTFMDGKITLDEIRAANEEVIPMIRQGHPPVHDIVDVTSVSEVPYSLKLLAQSAPFLREPKLGWLVLVTNKPMFSFLASTLSQISHKPLRVVKSLDEALATLQRQDMTLPDLTALKLLA